jgi:ABC-type transport system involved in multi-copper enzyme maturation permease subunit
MNYARQIWTIARLELHRVFFSRRSLWVYLLAIFPTLIFIGHAIQVQWRKQNWASERVTPAAALQSIREGMSVQRVKEIAGEPISERTLRVRMRKGSSDEAPAPESRRMVSYYDGERRYDLMFEDDKLASQRIRRLVDFEEDRRIFAGVFQFFYLRLAIFFGCLGIFINLFRGEMLDKSLHYWFLVPVKREVLLMGKYCAGLIAASVIFGTGALTSFLAMTFPQDAPSAQAFWQSAGVGHAAQYVAAAMLGCVGYGSVFLAAGLLMKNPITPAITLLFWESINGFLPEVLQKLSVLHYLQSLCPVPAPVDSNAPALLRMFLAPAPPSSAALAVLGLLGVTALVLFAASRAVRRLEINYGTE